MTGVNVWRRRFERERSARKQSEAILETRSRELYELTESLRAAREDLENQVALRTQALQEAVGNLEEEARKRLAIEEELRSSRDSALEVSELKTQFLARISHEMRTPMNAVIGLTGLLLDTELTKEQAERLATVRSSGKLLLRIINDILDLSKIDANKLELDYAPVQLENMIEQSISLVMLEAEKKGINFELNKQLFMSKQVIVDGGRVQQLLVNLLSNAVKYSDGGTVKVSVRLSKGSSDNAPQDLIGAVDKDDAEIKTLTIAVEDAGYGIRAEDLKNLFVPFTQFSGASVGSSGLGLTICHRICKMMGGNITVDSEFGRGSTFTISVLCGLPSATRRDQDLQPLGTEETTMLHSTSATGAWLLSGHADQETTAERASMAVKKPLTVLLADDYEVNRMVQHAQLEQLGYRADAVANGEEVLRALHARPYDVVLMDIRMPVMDGLEATKLIRERKDGPQPFIVAVTASALAGDREKFVAAGMDAYISKPVELGELASVLEQAFAAVRHESCEPGLEDLVEIEPVTLELRPLYARLGPAADGLLRKVIPVYLRELPRRGESLSEAFKSNDAQAFAQICHGLKGASSSVGAAELASDCERHEQRGYAGVLPGASELESLLDLSRRTGRALEARLRALDPARHAI